MFDKKQKSCVERVPLVTDNILYDRKAFYIVKIAFYSSFIKNFFHRFLSWSISWNYNDGSEVF